MIQTMGILPAQIRRWHHHVRAILVWSCLVICPSAIWAQGSPAAPAPPPPTEKATVNQSPAPPATADAQKLDVIYLPNEEGELVPVPADGTVKSYLQYLRDQTTGAPREVAPPVTVSSIELVGSVEEDRALLKAQIIVQVSPEKTASPPSVRQALGLGEAVLRKVAYTGDGSAAYEGTDPTLGQVWWFRGAGKHVLDLDLLVPIRKQAPARRLQLSLPTTAVSTLDLTIPYRVANFKMTDLSIVEQKLTEQGQTKIQLTGLGQRLDASWQLALDQPVETTLEAATAIVARVSADSVLLELTQRVQPLQGTLSTVKTTLPKDASVLKIEGREYQSHRLEVGEIPTCTVTLAESTTGPIALKWTVSLPRSLTSRLTIDQFSVEGARKQTGEIAIALDEGLRLSAQEVRDPNVVRVNVGELSLTPASALTFKRAYRFLSQPFQLAVDVERVEPYFVSRPRMMVLASADQILMDAEFDLQIYRGQVTEFVIAWPGFEAGGWKLDTVEPRDLVETYTLEREGERSLIRARLVQSVRDRVTLRLRARRSIRPFDPFPFTLPQLLAANRLPARLTLFEAENVHADLGPLDVLRTTPDSSIDFAGLPENYRNLRHLDYALENDAATLVLNVSPQSRQIRLTSRTECQFREGRLICATILRYDVAYENLSELRLNLPQGLNLADLRFQIVSGERLTAEALGNDGHCRLKLPTPRLGSFEVRVDFDWPLSEEAAVADVSTVVPLLESLDAPATQMEFEFVKADWVEASTSSSEWSLLESEPGRRRWRARNPQKVFPLNLGPVKADEVGPGVITRALMRGLVDRGGTVAMRTQYRVSGVSDSLMVVCPPTGSMPRFAWGERSLEASEILELPVGSRRFSLKLPGSDDGAVTEELLTIDYQLTSSEPLGWSGRALLEVPRLPQCAWVSQVVWQVEFPGEQYLFLYPDLVTPMFRWHRDGLFWRRRSEPSGAQLISWIGADQGPQWAVAAEPGNVYGFSQFGSPTRLPLRTLSAPMVLLLGAGLSLTIGFALLKVPVLRHILSLLILAFLTAVAGLWFMAPLELLLQPAIIGLIFPLVAIAIDRTRHRRLTGAVLTLPRSMDYSGGSGGGGSTRSAAAFPGSEDATIMRTVPTDERSSRRMETGTGVS